MIDMIEGLHKTLFRFCRESSGGVMIYFGIMLPVLLGVQASLWMWASINCLVDRSNPTTAF